MSQEITLLMNQLNDALRKEGRQLIKVELTTVELNPTPSMESCGFSPI